VIRVLCSNRGTSSRQGRRLQFGAIQFPLSLTLLVPRVRAEHPDHTARRMTLHFLQIAL